MSSRAIFRAVLLVAVVGAANAAKPFTPTNVTAHFLQITHSLSPLLPAAAVGKLAQAHLLAGVVSGEWRGERAKRPCPNDATLAQAGKLERKAHFGDGGKRGAARRATAADSPGRGSAKNAAPPVGFAGGKAVMMSMPVIALPARYPALQVDNHQLNDLRIPAFFTPPARKTACPLERIKLESTVILEEKTAQATFLREAETPLETPFQRAAPTTGRVTAKACAPSTDSTPTAGTEAKRAC